MDKVALVRTCNHQATAVHDTGHQMMQTGRLFTGGIEHPHIGCVLAKLKGPKGDAPPHVLLPRPIGNTGGGMPHGQSAGYLGKTFDPFVLNADPSAKDFKVPDLLPPDYITAVRESRRRSLREAIDGSVKAFESSSDARLLDANFQQAYQPDVEQGRPRGVRPQGRARRRSATATAGPGSGRAACWPAG